MINRPDTRSQRIKRHKRVRAKISGTPERPRLNVFRSETNIYAQVIDDVSGKTLVSASSLEKGFSCEGTKSDVAKKVGTLVAERAKAKGIEDAKKNMITVTLSGTTIPHEVIGEFSAGRVMMKPAAPGTGIIAGGPVRAVMEAVGIKDVRAKCLRSNNPQNVVSAAFQGLKSLRSPEEVARIRGKSVEEIVG